MQKYFFYTRRQIAKTNGQVFSDKWSNKKSPEIRALGSGGIVCVC